jgi:hypothetical protein
MSEAWLSFGAMQPVLPLAETLPWHIAVSWGACIAALLWGAARAWRVPALRWVAVLVFVAACVPLALDGALHGALDRTFGAAFRGTDGWAHGWTAYAALAFQTPSNVTCLGCLVWACWGSVHSDTAAVAAQLQSTSASVHRARNGWSQLPWLSLAGVALGWALWLDTFNRWPSVLGNVPFYAWGFGLPALVLVSVLLWAYAAWMTRATGPLTRGVHMVAGALCVFALTRWPTGNVWDALLDPWLWAACHVQGFKGCVSVWRASRTSKYSRQNSTFSGV